MTRRCVLVLAALLGCVALVPAAGAAPANLLVNPGFEENLAGHDWMPAGWDTSRAGLPTVFFGRDTLLPHTGRYAVSIANVSALYPMNHNWSQRLPVGRKEWGKDLVFTVWTRTTDLNGRGYVLLQGYQDTISVQSMKWGVTRDSAAHLMNIKPLDDPFIGLGWDRRTFIESETGWVQRQARIYVAPSTNVIYARIGLQGTGQILIDDASLTVENAAAPRAPAVGANLLKDPGFEGNLTDWELSMPPFDGIIVARDTTQARSGKASLLTTCTSGMMVRARTGVCQPISNRALAGKRIRLSGWVKTDSLKSVAYAVLYAHTPRGVIQEPQPQQFSHNTPWTRTTLEMDVPADATLVWAWFCYDAPRAGFVHWDDCSLEVLGKAKSPGRSPKWNPGLQ